MVELSRQCNIDMGLELIHPCSIRVVNSKPFCSRTSMAGYASKPKPKAIHPTPNLPEDPRANMRITVDGPGTSSGLLHTSSLSKQGEVVNQEKHHSGKWRSPGSAIWLD